MLTFNVRGSLYFRRENCQHLFLRDFRVYCFGFVWIGYQFDLFAPQLSTCQFCFHDRNSEFKVSRGEQGIFCCSPELELFWRLTSTLSHLSGNSVDFGEKTLQHRRQSCIFGPKCCNDHKRPSSRWLDCGASRPLHNDRPSWNYERIRYLCQWFACEFENRQYEKIRQTEYFHVSQVYDQRDKRKAGSF